MLKVELRILQIIVTVNIFLHEFLLGKIYANKFDWHASSFPKQVNSYHLLLCIQAVRGLSKKEADNVAELMAHEPSTQRSYYVATQGLKNKMNAWRSISNVILLVRHYALPLKMCAHFQGISKVVDEYKMLVGVLTGHCSDD